MENKHDRVLQLDDKLLFAMVEQKGAPVEKGRAISKEFEEMQAKLETLHAKMLEVTSELNNKKLHIFKRVEKLAKNNLSEFEIPVTTEVRDGKVVLIVTDAMAEFKDSFSKFDKFKEPVPRKQK